MKVISTTRLEPTAHVEEKGNFDHPVHQLFEVTAINGERLRKITVETTSGVVLIYEAEWA